MVAVVVGCCYGGEVEVEGLWISVVEVCICGLVEGVGLWRLVYGGHWCLWWSVEAVGCGRGLCSRCDLWLWLRCGSWWLWVESYWW